MKKTGGPFIAYIFILVSVIGLLGMVLGYTDPSLMRAILYISGITLFSIVIYKEKKGSKPRYLL